jgi:nitroreductase
MDVDQAIRRLRVVRDFKPDTVPDEELQAILEAGRRAGSSKNTQPRQFIVIRDRDRLEELSTVGDYAGHLAGAAVAVALVAPGPDGPDMWDLGIVAQNMFLAAWARGIGSAPATVYQQDRCREILGYPDDQRCEYILSFGYPADPTDLTRPLRRGGRRPLEEIIHQERW